MTLARHLAARIRAEGPISLADYMAEALLHPRFGYYTTRDPLGLAGDFVTAPEISQMFGELVGLSLAQSWMDQGRPAPFTLAELGPGRGTLMADVMRATRTIPGFADAAQITLIEASPTLRGLQAETLKDCSPRWLDTVTALPEQPLFLVANEFFDALPIRQFLRDGPGWRERRIGLEGDTLTFGLGTAQAQPVLTHRLEDTGDGDLVEYCSAAQTIMACVAQRISDHGGAALIFDYGDWRSLGDTFQAMADHAPVDPLAAPGQADLTAHVDFETLVQGLACPHTRLTPQGVFLERLGITARAQALAQNLSGEALESLVRAHRRLTHPEEMGNLFKVIGLYPAEATPPPGLER